MTLLLQTKTQPLKHNGTPMLVCPSQTVCEKRNFRLGAFLWGPLFYESMSQWVTNESGGFLTKTSDQHMDCICSFVNFILLRVSSITRLRQEGFTNWKIKTTIYIEILGLLIRTLFFFKKKTRARKYYYVINAGFCFGGLCLALTINPQNKTHIIA